jgi:type IV pilus assembly protein PilA
MYSSVIERLSARRDGAGESGADAGFTLIELMVVLLILAILLAIAIPTFLGVTGGANDRAAQSNLNTALTTAKTQETQNNQTYSAETAANLKTAEPSLNWIAGATTAQGDVSVWVDTTNGNSVVLASYSKSGSCWYAADNIGTVTVTTGPFTATGSDTPPSTAPGTYYGKATAANASACNATAALTGVTWASSFGNA